MDFAGDDSTGNFVLGSDHHGGTDIGFVAEARVLGGWHAADAGAFGSRHYAGVRDIAIRPALSFFWPFRAGVRVTHGRHLHTIAIDTQASVGLSGIGPLIAPQYQISTISTAVATSITLGGGAYASTLTVTGSGSVAPTAYGATAVYMNGTGDSLLNQGTITGGGGSFGQYQGGDGGAGVSVSGGTVTNSGTITGGGGGYGGQIYAGSGGAGLSLSGGTLTNDSTIAGGVGGIAVLGGNGGVGVSVSGGTVGNDGTIAGGSGGNGFYGGNGGAGVSVSGGTLTNEGTIAGGAGGSGTYGGSGSGAVGLYLNGGTVINGGTIAGYGSADAVQFGSVAATLVIDPGAVFIGNVAANSSVHDVLELSGTAAGTLGGLGTQFTGFTTIKEDAGANWSLAGANTLGADTSIKMYGRLGVPGQLTDAGTILVGHGGLLRAGGYGAILAGGITLYSGSLAEGATGTLVVGNTLAGAQEGALTVEAGYAIAGHGTIGGVAGNSVIDTGTITASGGGTLNLALAASGTGTLALDTGTALIAHGAVSVENILFNTGGNETLGFLAPASVTGTIAGFGAADVIDIENQKVKAVSFANNTLSLLGAHGSVLETLDFAGAYATGNFVLSSDHHGGTDIAFTIQAARVPGGGLTADAGDFDPLPATLHHFGIL